MATKTEKEAFSYKSLMEKVSENGDLCYSGAKRNMQKHSLDVAMQRAKKRPKDPLNHH